MTKAPPSPPSCAISVRAEHRSLSRSKGQRDHDLRRGSVPRYVDRDRSPLNSVLVEPMTGPQLRQLCEKRRAARPDLRRAMKADAAVSTNLILTFGAGAQPIFEALSREAQDRAYQAIADRIAAELGIHVTGLVAHRDETAPHAHVQLPAVRPDGLPVSKVLNPRMASRLQDLAAEEIARFAPGIVRGRAKVQRIADGEDLSRTVHRSVAQLHADLPVEIAAAQELRDQAHAEAFELERRLELLRGEIAAKMQEHEDRRREADKLAEWVAKLEAKAEMTTAETKRLEVYQRRYEAKVEEARRLGEEITAVAQAEARAVWDRVQAQAAEYKARVVAKGREDLAASRAQGRAEGLSLGRSEALAEVEELRAEVQELRGWAERLSQALSVPLRALRDFMRIEVAAEAGLLVRARTMFGEGAGLLKGLAELRQALERQQRGYRSGQLGQLQRAQDAPLLAAYARAGLGPEKAGGAVPECAEEALDNPRPGF